MNLVLYVLNNICMYKLQFNILRAFCQHSSKKVTLRFSEDQKVAYVTMSNPSKRNTLSKETIHELNDALLKTEEKKTAKILVLTGEGSVFSSGHDLKELGSTKNPEAIFDACAQLMLKLRKFPIPTLCGINGIAAAAGFQLALACDLIVATEKSSFSTPGIKWGLFCSTPGVELIRAISSEKKANQMLLFGQAITAQQAYQYGMVNKVVKEEDFRRQIESYIGKALSLSGQVLRLGKKVLKDQKELSIQQAYKLACFGMESNIKQKGDCQQGLKAFAEKRHPHFQN